MDSAIPSLSSRRKKTTQLEIASTAARLMAEQGSATVTVETIASEAGVGLRTFYRYFHNKYEAIAPLLTIGAADWREAIAHSELPIIDAIDNAIREALTVSTEHEQHKLDEVLSLLGLVAGDPNLASVWLTVNQDSELHLRKIIASTSEGSRRAPFQNHLLAAAATIAMRVALETWSLGPQDTRDMPVADAASHGFRSLTIGLVD